MATFSAVSSAVLSEIIDQPSRRRPERALPDKLYVELTTRCNLQCAMCVKHTAGSCIGEADLDPALFDRLAPSLHGVRQLVLNGIGESLLHPDLPRFIGQARRSMSPGSIIGLQSNGLLLSDELARDLLRAGLTTLCLSVDGFGAQDSGEQQAQAGHSFRAVQRALDNIAAARPSSPVEFALGLEIVLTRESVLELPALIRWAAENGVDYILTSHLLLYDEQAEKASLFSPHPPPVLELLDGFSAQAEELGLDFIAEHAHFKRFAGTRTASEAGRLLEKFQQELKVRDLACDLRKVRPAPLAPQDLEAACEEARRTAARCNIRLELMPLAAPIERRCRFVEENAAFVAVSGEVMPCHFLWHTYSCQVASEQIQVDSRSFGNLGAQSLEQIWGSPEYSAFRDEARRYEYSPCWTCGQGPCPTLVNDRGLYANDCYGSQVPCGHCLWNLGGVRCL